MASITPKSKLGYFSTYEILLDKIANNKIDAYDFAYVKSLNTFYILDKDLNPIEFKSRLESYQTEEEAIADLNSRTDTYEGKIVNIYKVDKYVPYIANISAVTGEYYVLEVSTISDIYDYNAFENKPIINIVADQEDNLILSELEDGYYNVLGTFKMSLEDETIYINTSNVLYVIKHEDDITYIRSLDAKKNDVYVVGETGETTVDEVPTVEEVNQIVGNSITEYMNEHLDDAIDDHISDIMATESDINNLFNQ